MPVTYRRFQVENWVGNQRRVTCYIVRSVDGIDDGMAIERVYIQTEMY